MAKNYQSVRQTKANIKQQGGKITISNIFAGTKEKGLEPNERGWYRLWGGAFNTKNARKDDYPLAPKLKSELTTPGSNFNLRMANGVIGGECNHPDIHLLPNAAAQKMRLNRIDKTRECLQVMKIELDSETYVNDDGSPVTAFWVWVKPTGAYGPAFEAALKDPDIQVTLSIRTESANTLRPNMTWNRVVTKIVAVDWVDIQGMAGATKMESLQYSMEDMHCLDEVEITAADIAAIEQQLSTSGCSMEDIGQDLDNLKEMIAEQSALTALSLQSESSRAYDF